MSNRTSNASKALAGTLRPIRTRIEAPAVPGLPPIDVAQLSPKAQEFLPKFLGWVNPAVVTPADTPAFLAMVEAYAEKEMHRQAIENEGAYQESVNRKTGSKIVRPHPAVAALSAADKRFQRYASMFGMTPDSRLKAAPVTDPATEKKNVFEDI